MPRTQDFSKSVIYHIRDIETKKVCYVGSTTNFAQRKSAHKHLCNKGKDHHYNLAIYCYIRDNGGFSKFEVIPISYFEFKYKVQLVIEEQKEITKHEGLINSKKAYLSAEEYNNYMKEWYQVNKERVLEKQKEMPKEKIECPICNSVVSNRGLIKHQRTKKCQKKIK